MLPLIDCDPFTDQPPSMVRQPLATDRKRTPNLNWLAYGFRAFIRSMKKSDVQCLDCGAGYRRIQLDSRPGKVGQCRCLVCGRLLGTFDGAHEVAYRIVVTPERPAGRSAKKLSY
jgi:hypothetical protein